ncbi:unnamed protein product [Clavelina lepadiformis]|uniref:BPTI/Kunitz inhibitor domain-containing protein n=1 Tax=Clavelina lepadiformis TaxID=159417 RepID=A0ABP0F797_CLALP
MRKVFSMSMNILIFLVLAIFSFSEKATAECTANIPPEPPKWCMKMPTKGPCRADHRRYRYNATSDECEFFVWGGCFDENSQNIFRRKEECEDVCKRNPVDRQAYRNSFMSCKFQANLGRECSIDSFDDFISVRNCIDLPSPDINRTQCVSRGCCWSFGSCYQKENAFVESDCLIRYLSDSRFVGKIVFQADRNYPTDWVGLLKFNVSIPGGLCILRDRQRPSGVGLATQAFEERTKFLLPALRPLYPGQNTVIMFSGSFDACQFSKQRCEYINLPEPED